MNSIETNFCNFRTKLSKISFLAIYVGLFAFAENIAFSDDSNENHISEKKAIHYLSKHIPRWKPQQKCFSCHHNGDATRAMFLARQKGFCLPEKVPKDTIAWLQNPGQWKNNGGGQGPQSDKKLAAIQFANALCKMFESREKPKSLLPTLEIAAKLILTHQEKDGSWNVDADSLLGSPVTYGRTLATVVCRNILETANAKKFCAEIQNANRWLDRQKPKNVFNAAAWLFSLRRPIRTSQQQTIELCLKIIEKGEDRLGGWGPYTNSQPEVFDTAMVILGVCKLEPTDETRKLIASGRAYLIKTQNDDGSWPETTRPPENQSYPNRVSTTAWALIALLETIPDRKSQ